jgi:hypothetical protein
MTGWLLALLIVSPLLAFGMWLTFNALLARWYGLDALKAAAALYRFRPADWIGRNLPAENQVPSVGSGAEGGGSAPAP